MARFGFSPPHLQKRAMFPVEVVYVATDKDLATIDLSVQSLIKIVGVRISVVSIIGKRGSRIEGYARETGIRFVDELELLGFGPSTYQYPEESGERSGWLYQQLLKLAWCKKAQETSYIIVDADTVFINNAAFRRGKRFIFYVSEEWNQPYSDAIECLLGFHDHSMWSYVAHMMIFDCRMVSEMLAQIESRHGVPWHEAIARTRALDRNSCVSEYHTYASWVKHHYPERASRRPLYNRGGPRPAEHSVEDLAGSLVTISYHSYIDP